MWCERVIRNVPDGNFAGKDVDFIDICWDECRSVLKKRSRAGEEVRVLLDRKERLRHGDMLFEDERRAMVINVLPCEVIVVRSESAEALANLAFDLGNLHWPTQIAESELIFIEEEKAMQAVERSGLTWSRQSRRFDPLPVGVTPLRVSDNVQILRSRDSRRGSTKISP